MPRSCRHFLFYQFFPFLCPFGYVFQQGLVLYRKLLIDLRFKSVNWLLYAALRDIFLKMQLSFTVVSKLFLTTESNINQTHQVLQLVNLVLHTERKRSEKKIILELRYTPICFLLVFLLC